MQLKDWMRKEGKTTQWVANKLGITDWRLRRIRADFEPTIEEIWNIAKLTEGKVTINDWAKKVGCK